MASRRDQERIRALLTEAITVLCKNGLGYNSEFCIDGLLGITVDNEDIFLVKINEKISREKRDLSLALEHHRDHFADRGSVTSTSPDRSSSLSQPPTPQSITAPQRTEYPRSDTQSRESSPRKRHWDSHTPEPEPVVKRSHGNSESSAIVIKEEVTNNSELPTYGVLTEQNGEAGLSEGKPGCSSWPQTSTPGHLPMNVQSYDDAQMDRGPRSESPAGATNPEPLDFTLSEEKRMLHSFNLSATAEATKAALLQHQKALLQAMSAAAVANTQHRQQQQQQQQQQSQQQQVWQHMNPEYLRLQHKLSRPYVCEECGKTFTSSCGRRRHMDTHRGIYPYRCEHCGKGFTASNNLKAHLTLHTNINNFKCDICGHAFRYSQYLKDHIRKEHVDVGGGVGGMGGPAPGDPPLPGGVVVGGAPATFNNHT